MYADMIQQRDRAERESQEAAYYRGLYHGVVRVEQRATSYTKSVRSHKTHNQRPTQSQQTGGSVGF